VNHQQMLILKNHARRHAQMKPFSNAQMKAWNQEAAADDLGLRFETMSRVTRFAVTVHDRDDQKVIRFNRVKYRVRKHASETPPHVLLENTPAVGSFLYLRQGELDAGDESQFQTILAIRVITRRILEFSERFGMELDSHRATALRTRFSASPPGMVLTRPLRTSSRRRRASAAQSL